MGVAGDDEVPHRTTSAHAAPSATLPLTTLHLPPLPASAQVLPLCKAALCNALCDAPWNAQVLPLCKAAGYVLTPIDTHFSDVSKLSHGSLREYATSILADLAATGDDALCKAFCTPSGSLAKTMFPAFSASKLLLENACYFPGMTLTVSSNPMEQIDATSHALVKEMPSLKALGKDLAAQEVQCSGP